MSEWKELEIDNLPPDFLTGDYEFEIFSEMQWEKVPVNSLFVPQNIINGLYNGYSYRYRHKDKPAPTHEEIITKWWRRDDGVWVSVYGYYPGSGQYVVARNTDGEFTSSPLKSWFIGRESATIPPETE
jgi:hypothetical protein